MVKIVPLKRILAFFFAKVLYFLLFLFRWKRKTVYANLCHIRGDKVSKGEFHQFYSKLLKNMTGHVGELLFSIDTFKRLPRNLSAYPCCVDGWNFALDTASIPVIEKMRGGGIFLTAHYGNYEAMGSWVCRLGAPLVASYIPLKPTCLNNFVKKKLRCVDGREYSIAARTPREFLKIIDKKDLFCLLADQDSRISSAVEGMLMGRKVKNNPLPDFLKAHRPHIPVFVCWMDESNEKRILFAQELNPQSSILNQYNDWLEERIKDNPSLWYGYTHRRFLSVNAKIYI